MDIEKIKKLRTIITENLRTQKGGVEGIEYIDVFHALTDMLAKQNHVVYGRRGCGKSLLLSDTEKKIPKDVGVVYLNCEDYKNHSFPNVLIEIIDAVFLKLESNLTAWFGPEKNLKKIIKDLRREMISLKSQPDERAENVKETVTHESAARDSSGLSVSGQLKSTVGEINSDLNIETTTSSQVTAEIEREYQNADSKVKRLSLKIPELKRQIVEFFRISNKTKSVFIEIDDFYHVARLVQPYVVDYIHRLCKDVPLYFKIATLRNSSSLFVERQGQPVGIQQRHDYQAINIDYSFQSFEKTSEQLKKIFLAFAAKADISEEEFDSLFKGVGFRRLVMAGGGVPRDCLSLFLELLVAAETSGEKIGKDEVRILSFDNFQTRIVELKDDSEKKDQVSLIKGIYVLRQFCLEKKTNIIMISDEMLQKNDALRKLISRLLDYRIIHLVTSATTHKSYSGTFAAYMIDIGCYANLRKLQGKMNEIDVSDARSKDELRATPVLNEVSVYDLWKSAPDNPEVALLEEPINI